VAEDAGLNFVPAHPVNRGRIAPVPVLRLSSLSGNRPSRPLLLSEYQVFDEVCQAFPSNEALHNFITQPFSRSKTVIWESEFVAGSAPFGIRTFGTGKPAISYQGSPSSAQ